DPGQPAEEIEPPIALGRNDGGHDSDLSPWMGRAKPTFVPDLSGASRGLEQKFPGRGSSMNLALLNPLSWSQCENRQQIGLFMSNSRVTPPNTASPRRLLPYPPATIRSAPCCLAERTSSAATPDFECGSVLLLILTSCRAR